MPRKVTFKSLLHTIRDMELPALVDAWMEAKTGKYNLAYDLPDEMLQAFDEIKLLVQRHNLDKIKNQYDADRLISSTVNDMIQIGKLKVDSVFEMEGEEYVIIRSGYRRQSVEFKLKDRGTDVLTTANKDLMVRLIKIENP